jgi:hypothetical protein
LHGALSFIQAFNARREACIRPGNLLCVSDSYTKWSGWQGEQQVWLYPQPPHWASLEFFKETLLKSCVDASTGIMLRLEFMDSELVMSQKPFRTAPHSYSAATALVMRLTEPWHRKEPRIVAASKSLSSVECLQACEVAGLKFIGAIKRASSRYPLAFLEKFGEQLGRESRGAVKVLTSSYRLGGELEEMPRRLMHAVWWKGKRPVALLTNASTTESVHFNVSMNAFGDVATVMSHPKCLDMYYRGVSAVNAHDYFREGQLGIESCFKAQRGWQQIFATVWGMIITDAFLAHRFFKLDLIHLDPEHMKQEFMIFCGKLAFQMIHSAFDDGLTGPLPTPVNFAQSACEEHKLVSVQVAIQQLDGEHNHKDWQLKCKICGAKTRKFCLKCSSIESKKLFGICSDSTAKMKPCFAVHKSNS